MVFEVLVDSLGGEGQVCGGGSYRLFHLFDLEELDPCCGFGMGFDRVLLALEVQAQKEGSAEVVPGENSGPGVLAVIPFKVDNSEVLPLVGELRAAGQPVTLELRSRKTGRSLAWADASGATYVMVVGPRDLESGDVTIKRLSDGAEAKCGINAEEISQTISMM
jgi:histidyl-tRNA synthetase